ncbi:uncharacterized protein RB166_012226 [Leptodactylus fuscus]
MLDELKKRFHDTMNILGHHCYLLVGLTLNLLITFYDISRDGLDKFLNLLLILKVRLNKPIRWCFGALVFLGNKVYLLLGLILDLLIRICDTVNSCWHILLLLGVGVSIWKLWQIQLLTKEISVALRNNEQHLRHQAGQSNNAFDILNLYLDRFEIIGKVFGWIFNAVTKLF